LREELKYITYPAQLADHVEGLLRKNDYEKALAMTRLSSRALANTVSWNYMIEYLMKQGKRKDGIALFNEVGPKSVRHNRACG
jgi:pentatricopeptide repeat protein